MQTVGVKELKDRLSYYLRKVKRGEKIIVTEREKAIASLVPIGSGEAAGDLLTLVQEGFAAWNGGKPRGAMTPIRLARSSLLRDRPRRPAMIAYLDTSSLVKLYVEEAGVGVARSLSNVSCGTPFRGRDRLFS